MYDENLNSTDEIRTARSSCKKAIYFAINTSVLHYITVFVENLDSGVLGAPVLFATEFTISSTLTTRITTSVTFGSDDLQVIMGKSLS